VCVSLSVAHLFVYIIPGGKGKRATLPSHTKRCILFTTQYAVDVGESYQQTVDAGPGKQSLRAWKKKCTTLRHTQRESVLAGCCCVCVVIQVWCVSSYNHKANHTKVFLKKNIRFCHCDFLLSKHLIKE
jgi:hypothetical protein